MANCTEDREPQPGDVIYKSIYEDSLFLVLSNPEIDDTSKWNRGLIQMVWINAWSMKFGRQVTLGWVQDRFKVEGWKYIIRYDGTTPETW